MLCHLLDNFLEGYHSSNGNRVDHKVSSLEGSPKQLFAEDFVNRSGSYCPAAFVLKDDGGQMQKSKILPWWCSALPCNLTHYWEKVCNLQDVCTHWWAQLSVHLRGLHPPPPVFRASGYDGPVSIMNPSNNVPLGQCLLWRYHTYL